MASKIRMLLLLIAVLMLCSCLPPDDSMMRQEKDLPTMLTLGANYCQYCRAMKPSINKLSSAYSGKVNVLYVDVERYPDYARRYNAQVVPYTVFMDKSGRVLASKPGYMEEAEMRHYLNSYLLK